MSFAVANRFRMDNAGLQVDNGASVRGWNFGHSSGQDRRRDEPATVRGFASTVDVRGNSGIRIPHPRCEHRRGSCQFDEVQHPEPERSRRAGAGQPELIERTYINSKILEGSTQLQIAPLEEAIKLLTILLAGWEEAAKKEDLAVPTTLLAGQAANTGRFRLHA